MNVLLIRPPRRNIYDAGLSVPPLGLAYIASSLREQGHTVEILDAYALRWSWSKMSQHLQNIFVDVIGFTVMTPMLDTVAKAVKIVRSSCRFLIVGGPHPTAVKHDVFDDLPEIDYAVVGEGELVVCELLDYLQDRNSNVPSQVEMKLPNGVVARKKTFVPASTPNVHDISLPSRDLLPQKHYHYLFATKPGFATMISSRGCPFRCSFCDKSVGGSRWRARSAVDVVDEMETLQKENIGFINFYDDNFLLSRSRVVAICEEILRRNLQIEWKCEGRVDSVDLELLQLMRRAGCRVIAYGVESGNAQSLELLRKDITVEQSVTAFQLTKQAGIRSLAYMILGVPGEDTEDVERSIQFVDDIGADYAQFSSLTSMPGTPISQSASFVSVKNPLDADIQRRTLTDMNGPELQRLLQKAWLSFYIQPKRMYFIGRDSVRSGSWREGLRLGRQFGLWFLQN